MVMDWLVHETRRHGLKKCAKDWFNMDLTEYEETFGHVPEGKKKLIVPEIHEIIKKQKETFVDHNSIEPAAYHDLTCYHLEGYWKISFYDAWPIN